MSESPERKSGAWQPLTPRGVAAFARAPVGRLLLVQFIFALLAAAVLVWFLRTAWFPTVRAAIQQLPDAGEIQAGKLNWAGDSPHLLAEGHFLAFVVDTNHSGALRSPAQIQIEFGRADIRFYSLAGYHDWPYPPEWKCGFNGPKAQPWWGAWEPPIQWLAFAGMLFWCMVSWALLATFYFLPAWLGAFIVNRDLSLAGAWKLAGAGLMPGALAMIAGLLLYGLEVLDLVPLAAVFGVHLVAGWVWVIWAVVVSPKLPTGTKASENPFVGKAAREN